MSFVHFIASFVTILEIACDKKCGEWQAKNINDIGAIILHQTHDSCDHTI